MRKISLYAISDLHLSFGVSKPMDVFPVWKNYTQKLEENWNCLVTNNDTVVIAGDISWAMNFDECVKDFSFLENLPGEKIILKGNHDYWWGSLAKINNFFNTYNFKSFKVLQNTSIETQNFCICGSRGWIRNPKNDQDKKICAREIERLKLSIGHSKGSKFEKIAFFHYPPIYGSEIFIELVDLLLENNVNKCYYGHIHSEEAMKKKFEGLYNGISFNFISCDYLNFVPKLVG